MTAPTLTVLPVGTKRHITVILNADAGSTVTLWRVVDNRRTGVRGVEGFATTTTQTVFVDYELPQNTPISYVAAVTKAGITTETSVVPAGTVDFGGDVIFDLGMPWMGLVVNVKEMRERKHAARQTVLEPLERTDPVVVSGVRLLPSATLRVYTLTAAEREQMLGILRSGNVIAFSPHRPEYGLDPVTYFAVGEDVVESRVSPLAMQPEREWALPVQQVAMPPAAYIFPRGTQTWGDIKAAGVTWGTLLSQLWVNVAGL